MRFSTIGACQRQCHVLQQAHRLAWATRRRALTRRKNDEPTCGRTCFVPSFVAFDSDQRSGSSRWAAAREPTAAPACRTQLQIARKPNTIRSQSLQACLHVRLVHRALHGSCSTVTMTTVAGVWRTNVKCLRLAQFQSLESRFDVDLKLAELVSDAPAECRHGFRAFETREVSPHQIRSTA